MASEDVLRSAEAYISRHGTVLQRERVAALIHGTRPSPEALALWREGHQHDGGWASSLTADVPPGGTRGKSTLIATSRALRYARELDLGVVPEVRGALLWVTRQQRPDGGFVDELPAVTDELDAQRLSSADSRMMDAWATAAALHILDDWIAFVQPYSQARQWAYDWLMTRVENWEVQYLRTVWLAAAAALCREGPDSGVALKLIALLTLRVDDTTRPPSARDLADLAITLAEAGWPTSASPVSRAMTLLERTRRNDGAFVDPQGREDTCEATIAAIRAYIVTGTPALSR